MNCNRFSEILADFREGKLSPGEQADAEAHLAICPACLMLLDIVRGNVDLLPGDLGLELTRFVLEHTSGAVCPRVEPQLWEFIEGSLGKQEAELVALHLQHCSGCRSMAGNIAVLREELPGMSEIEPGGSFAEAVAELTSGRHETRQNFRERLQGWWNRLIQRPLFSYEAAYVGTLVLLLAFTPVLPFRDFAVAEIRSAAAQSSENYLISIWTRCKPPIYSRLVEFASVVNLGDKPVTESLSKIANDCESASSSVLNRGVDSLTGWGRELIRNSGFARRD